MVLLYTVATLLHSSVHLSVVKGQGKPMGLASRSTVFLLLSWVSLCISVDQLTPTKPLTFPDDKLISNNGAFALGFFSPSNSSTRFYIGIWYNNNVVPDRTIVWVANRDNPITTPSSAATLAVTNHSDLVLSDPQGHIYWRTTTNNTTAGGGTAAAAMALLNDKGNLVLQSPEGATLWQSFDHPTDTILPGMPVWVNFRTRFTQSLVSWRSADDPSSGDFSLSADVGSGIQYVLKRGPLLLWRSGAWNGEMVLDYTPSKDSAVIIMSIVSNGDDISLMFSVSDGSPSMYLRVSYTGRYEFTVWNTTTSAWIVMIAHPGAGCDRYASCGPFGYCDATEAVATCKCPEGFEPNNGTSPPSGGCRRKEPLGCGAGDYFATLPGVKTPAMPVFVRNRSLDSCTADCRGNCSCTAYAYTNLSTAISGGDLSRCLLWFGDLVDIDKDVNINRENLYLRLAGSSTSTAHKKNNLAKILLPITAFVLLLAFPALVWTYKYRGTRQKKNVQKRLMLEYFRSTNGTGDRNIEFPFIRFDDIIAATDNFSDANMLGKGGFGKVYKGLLEGTNEVAVKRLSKSSGQGTEEFRNEVVLIAKLQHKNLVRLLGCCIHEDEKLLVYEYMPNKSLDYFLFDPARKLMLQWPTRFKIIKGVARGIMYLHQDSRLTIIHRDLKASNILLDKEMIPKISDFGMARIFGGDQHEANTNRVVGTYGYMSPEYAMEGAFSVKSDTYSFGVLLLEIVSGLKISSQNLIIDFPNLIVYAWNLWKDGKIEDVVDSSMKENYSLDEVSRCIHIALLCVQDSPNCRPFMSAVVFMLENKTTPLPIPMQPVYFASRDTDPGRASKDRVFSVNDMSLTALEGR